MPTTTNITVTGDADRRLRTFAQKLTDWTPYWRELAERLAETAQDTAAPEHRSDRAVV